MMEQLYTDFTTKLLPKVAEGFSMTKDYFLDLFGRYIKYLIVTDLILIGIGLLVMVVLAVLFRWMKGKYSEAEKKNEVKEYYRKTDTTGHIIVCLLCVAGIVGSFIFTIFKATDLVKDIYIPEVRVYEQLRANPTP